MKTYEEQIDAGLAYARAALTARLGEVKGETEREQDAALALAIVALVAAQRNERATVKPTESRASTPSFRMNSRADANSRDSGSVSYERGDEAPVIINFERARASFAAERSCVPRARTLDRRVVDCASPRLSLYRGE